MRTKLFRGRNIEGRMSAATITADTRDMVSQMVLPLVAQRRVKGALDYVSRESGVSYSKLRKIHYGLTDHILAFEWKAIANAYAKHVERQELLLTRELEQLRSLKAANLQRGLFDADPETPSRAVATTARADTDTD